jgi:hypothetical protein
LTRSHHIYRPRFTSLTTRSQSRDHGVTLFKTCTAEVFRPVPTNENRGFQVIETRKDSAVHVSLSSSSLVKQPGAKPLLPIREAFEDLIRRRMTTGSHRLLIHSSKVRSFTDTTAVLAESQDSAALSGRVISPPDRPCQRPLSTNRRIVSLIFAAARPGVFGDFAPYLSHNPTTFCHTG